MPESNDDVHLTIPRSVAFTLGAALLAGGAGAGLTFGPHIEKAAIQACYENSQTALKVAADHGTEIKNLETMLLDRTKSRWTADDHRIYERAHTREHDLIEKRIEFLEGQLERN